MRLRLTLCEVTSHFAVLWRIMSVWYSVYSQGSSCNILKHEICANFIYRSKFLPHWIHQLLNKDQSVNDIYKDNHALFWQLFCSSFLLIRDAQISGAWVTKYCMAAPNILSIIIAFPLQHKNEVHRWIQNCRSSVHNKLDFTVWHWEFRVLGHRKLFRSMRFRCVDQKRQTCFKQAGIWTLLKRTSEKTTRIFK
jgi:hypothetical protein